MSALSGKVQTVLGPVAPGQLGRTLTHEHLAMTFDCCFCPPPPGHEGASWGPITMENLSWIRQHPYSHRENLQLAQEREAVREELLRLRAAGGGTVVDVTTRGIGRDLQTLRWLAQETGVHIVSGAGFYVDTTHAPATRAMSVEQLTQLLIDEILHGADGTSTKCGVIGEIGCSWPLTESERRVLQATAQAQAQLGCPVTIHPGRSPSAPFQIIRVLQEAGADISKTVMSHLDRVRLLVDEGYGDRILLAHDIHTKHRLTKFGGHGYAHILTSIVPKMLRRGLAERTLHQVLVENPKRWLTFK
ncbi:N-acetyltaurine hydrolase isoform X2 [Tamandua tetradactyla]|uniref:N-acetyltaurine hydrolase isoform X2 n=1 Tax=Tamandua tetradactyla TaxID=48850 RepID=UPI004053BCF6